MRLVRRSEISKEKLESIAARHYIECEEEYKYVYEIPNETAEQIMKIAKIPVEIQN